MDRYPALRNDQIRELAVRPSAAELYLDGLALIADRLFGQRGDAVRPRFTTVEVEAELAVRIGRLTRLTSLSIASSLARVDQAAHALSSGAVREADSAGSADFLRNLLMEHYDLRLAVLHAADVALALAPAPVVRRSRPAAQPAQVSPERWEEALVFARRSALRQFAHSIARYGLEAEDIAAMAVERLWAAQTYWSDPDARSMVSLYVGVAGLTLIRRAQPATLPMDEVDEESEQALHFPDAEPASLTMWDWPAIQKALETELVASARHASSHRVRLRFNDSVRVVAVGVIERAKVSADFLDLVADSPMAAAWQVAREELVEFRDMPGQRLPEEPSARRSVYRLLNGVLAALRAAFVGVREESAP
ncbi:MAG: hypothetical protein QOI10_3809 [Solirubrobacterales bacterium]|nr:hypothetical protein [Solirubrobacterales bacterium]